MPRLTISLPQITYSRLSSLSVHQNESLSNIINRLIQIGMNYLDEDNHLTNNHAIEQHCQQLIIQMNVLIKHMSAEMLKFTTIDFEQLNKAVLSKCNELRNK